MASRQEEKERRRLERLEREQAEARKASSRRRLQLAGGGAIAVAAIVAVVVALASGGGDDGPSASADVSGVTLPATQITNLNEAAQAAGCQVKTFPSEGQTHLASDTATFNEYKTNPPTSGTHRPNPAEDGIYSPGQEPDKENWVHTLEHGRIITMYKPGLPAAQINQLEALFNEDFKGVAGYHQAVLQNNTNMPFQVAAVAWTHYLGCPAMNDKVFDAIRAFRESYVDKAPEKIP